MDFLLWVRGPVFDVALAIFLIGVVARLLEVLLLGRKKLHSEPKGGVFFKNDFVIFDEAHTVESVATRHIGVSTSSGQIRFALNRLYN
ncbi:MAG: hypothetical protein HGA75_18655, partial [Thiobacillus sp.]|nr:hypothetical protein [Thiobacillus sp.]